jgi:cytochrome c
MNPIPVPRDIPLPLPASEPFLELLLVVAFIAHILFVNLMVGGSMLVLAFEVRGLKVPDYDRLARELARLTTVNKSLAVVLGVAPLLAINVLYTVHFYTANALTGTAWILLIPTIACTFLLLYAHKYSWERLRDQKRLHIGMIVLPTALLLLIPLVFLANVNLMMFPEHWTSVRGFLSALALPNVLPRYFHFLCASLIVTSLFSIFYFGRARYPFEQTFETLSRSELRKALYGITLVVSLAQFLVGPLVLFTLPNKGLNVTVLASILAGAALAIPAVWLVWKEVNEQVCVGRRLPYIVGYLTCTVLFMVLGRHMYRGVALAEHRAAIRATTERWSREVEQAAYEEQLGIRRKASGVSEEQVLFESTCGSCHAVDRVLVGPPLSEIARLYDGRADGIVTWARAPGKKRDGFPQMPAFDKLPEAKLARIARYMLEAGQATTQPQQQ